MIAGHHRQMLLCFIIFARLGDEGNEKLGLTVDEGRQALVEAACTAHDNQGDVDKVVLDLTERGRPPGVGGDRS